MNITLYAYTSAIPPQTAEQRQLELNKMTDERDKRVKAFQDSLKQNQAESAQSTP